MSRKAWSRGPFGGESGPAAPPGADKALYQGVVVARDAEWSLHSHEAVVERLCLLVP